MVSSARFFALERHATAAGGFAHRSQPCSSTGCGRPRGPDGFLWAKVRYSGKFDEFVVALLTQGKPGPRGRWARATVAEMAEEPNGAQDHAEPARGSESHSKRLVI
jgi:hypothetical protein